MTIGESIKKGFGVAKGSLGLVLLLSVFGTIFSLIQQTQAPVDANAAPSPAVIAAGIVYIFLAIFFQAGQLGYVRDKIKTGQAALSNFLSAGGKYYLPVLVLGVIVAVIIGVCVLLAALVVAFLQNVQVVAIPLAILFGALGIYFVVMLFLSPYAIVVDGKSVKESLGTSSKLVKKNILGLLGIVAILIVVGFAVGLVLGALLAGVGFIVKQEMASQVVFAVLTSFVNAYLGIAVTGAFMNFYLSLPERNNS